jgi:O-antigen ligase
LETCLRAITLAGVVAGLLTPAVYAQVTWFAFTSLKVFWLQAAVGLSLPAYIVLACRRREFRPPRTWMMLAILAHLGSIALSGIFSNDPHKAWWGTLDIMGGLWSLLHFAAWATMAASVARTWRDWRRFLHIEIAVGLAAGCIAILQVPFPVILGQATDVRISGLFGNPIYSAAYHSLILFLVVFSWAVGKRPARTLLALYLASAAVSIVAIVLAGSRGPMLGLACGAGATTLAFGLFGRRRRMAFVGVLCLSGVLGIYLSFAALVAPRPGLTAFWQSHPNLAHLFILQDDSHRFDYWRLAWSGIREHPLVGWGQDNFEELFDRHFVPLEGCNQAGADNAHNIVLQALATTGIVGLVALAFLWGAVAVAILRARRRGDLHTLPATVLLGLPVAHLVQLLFNPESPGTLLLCYLLFALSAWLERPAPTVRAIPRWRPGLGAFALAELAGLAIVTAFTILPACASEMALLAVTDYRHNHPQESWRHARQAASVPSPYLEDQLSVDLQLLLSKTEGGSPERFPEWRELFALDRLLAERYLARHKTLRFRLTYARLLSAIGLTTNDQSLVNEGERRLREILHDHPKRQTVMFTLGGLLADRGRLDEAEQLYRRAFDEETRVGESRFRLGRFLWRYHDLASQGASHIAEGTKGECGYFGRTLDEVVVIATAFAQLGDLQGLRRLVPIAEETKPTPSARPYLAFALLLEQAQMLPERDRILRFGMEHAPELTERALPVLQGQRKTLTENKR